MRLITTEGIEIDVENSQKYGGIFVTGGKFTGFNVAGNFESTLSNFTCNATGEHNVQVYVNVRTGGVFLEEKKVEDSCIPQTFHIGGIVVDCDGCGNYIIKDVLLPENPCIAYARPFSSAFSISGKGIDNNFGDFNKVKAQYDMCSIIVGQEEFNSDYNCDYAIQGTTIPCPEVFALFNGNNALYDGNGNLINGNTPNPNPIN